MIKYYMCAFVALVIFFTMWNAIFPLINYLVYSQKPSSALSDVIVNDSFIPLDSDIQDTVGDDLFLLAWDASNRTPRFFNKKTALKYKKENEGVGAEFDHDLKLSEMTMASAATPYYFNPFKLTKDGEDTFFLSGDNIAMSPALFAYLHAIDGH